MIGLWQKKRMKRAGSLSPVWGHGEKVAICTSKRKFSPDTAPAGTLTLNFQCPQLCENKCQLFKPSTPKNKNCSCVGQPSEKAMATHSSTLAWKIPWMEEPGAAVPGVTKSWTRLRNFTFTFRFHTLEKEMATHSSVLAWRIPGTREPGGLPSMGLHRVGHD